MNESHAKDVLARVGARLSGHFVLSAGDHSNGYVNKDEVYPHTRELKDLCFGIAEAFSQEPIAAVIGPEIGGIVLQTWVADFLTDIKGHQVYGIIAEKTGEGKDDPFVIKRGQRKHIEGKSVLIVEDILTSGGTVARVVAAAREVGASPDFVAALVNRNAVNSKDVGGVQRLFALINEIVPKWSEADCPLCKDRVPISVEVGHGKQWLEKRAAEGRPYPGSP